MFRRMSKTKWTDKLTNNEVCDKLKVERFLLKTVKQRKMAYFGHI